MAPKAGRRPRQSPPRVTSSQSPRRSSPSPGRKARNTSTQAPAPAAPVDIAAITSPLNDVLSGTLSKGVLQVFQEWDADGVGGISCDQLQRVLIEIGVPADHVPMLFSMADANKDGRIDYDEFVAWVFAVAPLGVPLDTPPPFHPESGDQQIRDRVDEILPGLFLSNFRGAADLAVLKPLNILSVLCVNGTAEENPHPDALTYMNIENVTDDEDQARALRDHFDAAARFIHDERKRGGVVVHCAAGISRSSTCVLYYLMKFENMRLRHAFAHTLSRRRVIWPNKGFMARLIECEEALGLKPASISLSEYSRWTDYDAHAYAEAKIADRPGTNPRDGPRDYSKLKRNLDQVLKMHGKDVKEFRLQPVVLLSTGSLCPVHKGHIRNFAVCKKALEQSRMLVVGGFISPTHDDYVMRKYKTPFSSARTGKDRQLDARKNGWLEMHQRLELVQLAVAESDWIVADGWEVAQDEFVDYSDVAGAFQEELARLFPLCKLFYVCGEDLGRYTYEEGLSTGVSTCVVSRPGHGDLSTKSGAYNGNYVVVGEDIDVSSTAVRKHIKDGRLEEAQQLLHPAVYDRLLEMGYHEQLA